VVSQSGWQAMWGNVYVDSDLEKEPLILGYKVSAKEGDTTVQVEMPPPQESDVGWSPILLLYWLGLFVNVVMAAGVVAVGFGKQLIPPALQPYLRWRWPVVALLTLGTFAFLLLQDSIGFGVERQGAVIVEKEMKKLTDARKEARSNREAKEQAIIRGAMEKTYVRTSWYRWAFWLHFWAVVFVVVTMLADLRSPRPCPRVDLLW
jgi:hypothetical protein